MDGKIDVVVERGRDGKWRVGIDIGGFDTEEEADSLFHWLYCEMDRWPINIKTKEYYS